MSGGADNTRSRLRLVPQGSLLARQRGPLDRYLDGRSTEWSRYTAEKLAHSVARLLSDGICDARTLDWARVTNDDMRRLRALAMDRWSLGSARNALKCATSLVREAWRAGAITAEEMMRTCDVRPVPAQRKRAGRAVPGDDLRDLAAAAASPPAARTGPKPSPAAQARDLAILAVLWETGMRPFELCALDLRDLEPDKGGKRAILRIRKGKGGQPRDVYLGHRALEAVHAWIAHRGTGPGALFRTLNHGQLGARMTRGDVYDRVKRWERIAGTRRLTTYDFRRTMVSDLLRSGKPGEAQTLAGHAHASTTLGYNRISDDAAERAAVERDEAFPGPGRTQGT